VEQSTGTIVVVICGEVKILMNLLNMSMFQ